VKRPKERIVLADCFTASTVLIRFTGGPKKMWVRIRAGDEPPKGARLASLLMEGLGHWWYLPA